MDSDKLFEYALIGGGVYLAAKYLLPAVGQGASSLGTGIGTGASNAVGGAIGIAMMQDDIIALGIVGISAFMKNKTPTEEGDYFAQYYQQSYNPFSTAQSSSFDFPFVLSSSGDFLTSSTTPQSETQTQTTTTTSTTTSANTQTSTTNSNPDVVHGATYDFLKVNPSTPIFGYNASGSALTSIHLQTGETLTGQSAVDWERANHIAGFTAARGFL